jgi:hypothetical protein
MESKLQTSAPFSAFFQTHWSWLGISGILSRHVGNADLERLSDLVREKRIGVEAAKILILSVTVLDCLLLNNLVSVENETAVLKFVSNLGSGYRNLLRDIQIGVRIPPESLLHSVQGLLLIFWKSSQSFEETTFHFCGAEVGMVSVLLMM